MDRVWQIVSSFEWWFSVVVAGLLLNVLGSYFRGSIDKVMSSAFRNWSELSEKGRSRRRTRVERAGQEMAFLVALSSASVHTHLRGAVLLLLGVGLTTMTRLTMADPGPRFFILASLAGGAVFVGMLDIAAAINLYTDVREAANVRDDI